MTVTAVNGQDIPLVQGLVLLAAAVFVATNLVVTCCTPSSTRASGSSGCRVAREPSPDPRGERVVSTE